MTKKRNILDDKKLKPIYKTYGVGALVYNSHTTFVVKAGPEPNKRTVYREACRQIKQYLKLL